MTEPLPTGCIKKAKKAPSLREFNLLLGGISDEDKIGHLFIVDIIFDEKRATQNTMPTALFNRVNSKKIS